MEFYKTYHIEMLSRVLIWWAWESIYYLEVSLMSVEVVIQNVSWMSFECCWNQFCVLMRFWRNKPFTTNKCPGLQGSQMVYIKGPKWSISRYVFVAGVKELTPVSLVVSMNSDRIYQTTHRHHQLAQHPDDELNLSQTPHLHDVPLK